MTIAEWAQFIFFGIGGAFGLLCLFDGARRLAAGHPGGRGPRLAVGVAIIAMLAGYAYWQHQNHDRTAMASRLQPPASELPADWGKKISPAKRESVSQGMARRAFIDSGKLTPYVDAAGQRRAFVPAQDDLKQREAAVVAVARIEHKAANAFVEAMLWLILGASALVFGLFFGLERAPKPEVPGEAETEPPA